MGGGKCTQLGTCTWAGEMGGIGEQAKRGKPTGRNATTTREGTGWMPDSRATSMVDQQFNVKNEKFNRTTWHLNPSTVTCKKSPSNAHQEYWSIGS